MSSFPTAPATSMIADPWYILLPTNFCPRQLHICAIELEDNEIATKSIISWLARREETSCHVNKYRTKNRNQSPLALLVLARIFL